MFNEPKLRSLTPKSNKFYYNIYFIIGYIKHPKRMLNFIKFKLNKFSPFVNYYPTTMDIEPTQQCNFKCVMCVSFVEKKENMTFETFKNIIDEQFGLIEVKIQGVGEPLLNKDLIKMIEYARKKWLWVRTTTNGSLLHVNDNYKKLVDSGIHDVNISIDGCTKEVYESIRIGGNFEQLKENCKLINDYNNKVKKTPVRAWVVLQKSNMHQFFDFPRFFADLGFKEMTLSFALHNYGKDSNNSEATEFNISDSDLQRVINIGEELGIKVTFWQHPHFSGESFCKIPFNRVYVTTDSHILPCCYIANPEVVDFGSYGNFNKIWNEKYVKFRKDIANRNTVPEFCKLCYGEK